LARSNAAAGTALLCPAEVGTTVGVVVSSDEEGHGRGEHLHRAPIMRGQASPQLLPGAVASVRLWSCGAPRRELDDAPGGQTARGCAWELPVAPNNSCPFLVI
jgi:hypothetical protein